MDIMHEPRPNSDSNLNSTRCNSGLSWAKSGQHSEVVLVLVLVLIIAGVNDGEATERGGGRRR